MAPKKDLRGSEGDVKHYAKWDDQKTEIFLKICIEEIEAGNRPTTHFSKEGWKNLQTKFQESTSCAYDRIKLKNRWDGLKREFASFAKLVEKETGLGWDNDKKTIIADEQWWIAKSKEDPEILKWKNGGPKFYELLEKCFRGQVATGISILKPYQDPPSFEVLGEEERNGAEDHENNLIIDEEEEDDVYEVGNNIERNGTPTSSNMNFKKRKYVGKGERKMGTAERLQRSLDRIIDGMDPKSSKSDDPTSYEKCLSMLDEVPCIVQGSYLYYSAMRLLAKKDNRTAFFHLMKKDPNMVIDWLGTFSEVTNASSEDA